MLSAPLCITVITVTYNAEKYLEQTIESVINQDYSEIEYIIIDGGSTDGTVEIIKKYENKLAYWISESDRGIYDAMNKGIAQATGEWINFMNAGDVFISPSILSEIISHLSPQTGLLCGAIERVNAEGTLSEIRFPNGLKSVWRLIPAWHQAMVIKTSLMKQYLYDTGYKIAGDHDFLLKCYVCGERFEFTDRVLCKMLIGGLNEQEATRARIESLFALARYIPDEKGIYESVWFQALKANEPKDNRLYVSMLFNKLVDQITSLRERYKKIALYGYGKVGTMVASLCRNKLVVIADKEDKGDGDYPWCYPEELVRYEFDVLIIAVLGREETISEYLKNQLNIPDEKIVSLAFDD